jgi:hypothetical protein
MIKSWGSRKDRAMRLKNGFARSHLILSFNYAKHNAKRNPVVCQDRLPETPPQNDQLPFEFESVFGPHQLTAPTDSEKKQFGDGRPKIQC